MDAQSIACRLCSKKVYANEGLRVNGICFHNSCFKCQANGCAVKLTVNTFFRLRDKYYCKKHASGEPQQVAQEILDHQAEIRGPIVKYDVTNASSRSVEFPLCPTLIDENYEVKTTRVDFDTNIKTNRAFVIEGLLTDLECDFLIETTESIGYHNSSDIHLEYPTSHRNNERMIFISPILANTIWRRIRSHLKQSDISNVTPIGFCSKGAWIPTSVNDGIVFSKYSPGQFFKPHKDGLYINNNEEHSIFSVVIYLNELEGKKGGRLNFLDESALPENKIAASFTPKKGSAIIFNSDAYHEGEYLNDGFKFILRTFIMFKCINSFSNNTSEFKKHISDDLRWKEIVSLFSQIEKNSFNGNVDKFQDMFLRAQSIQHKASRTIHKWKPFIPFDCFRIILSELSINEILTAMRINQDWYRMCRDNVVWKGLFESKYSEIAKQNANSFDFFGLYKKQHHNSVSVMVLGDYCTYLKGDFCTQRLPSCICEYSRWDGSMLEPYEKGATQNWYDMAKKQLTSSDYDRSNYMKSGETLYYFANLAVQQSSYNENNNLLIITFPLLWGFKEEKDKTIIIEDQPMKKIFKFFDNCSMDDKWYYGTSTMDDMQETENFNSHLDGLARLSSATVRILAKRRHFDGYDCMYGGRQKRIHFGFLDASIAACAAYDLKNARILFYQKLGFELVLHIVDVKSLRIVTTSDKFFHLSANIINSCPVTIPSSQCEEIINYLCESNNVIFVSDTVKNNRAFQDIMDQISTSISTKNRNINMYYPSHYDLYYGGRKMIDKTLSLSYFGVPILGSVVLPSFVKYVKKEDQEYFDELTKQTSSGKRYKGSY